MALHNSQVKVKNKCSFSCFKHLLLHSFGSTGGSKGIAQFAKVNKCTLVCLKHYLLHSFWSTEGRKGIAQLLGESQVVCLFLFETLIVAFFLEYRGKQKHYTWKSRKKYVPFSSRTVAYWLLARGQAWRLHRPVKLNSLRQNFCDLVLKWKTANFKNSPHNDNNNNNTNIASVTTTTIPATSATNVYSNNSTVPLVPLFSQHCYHLQKETD